MARQIIWNKKAVAKFDEIVEYLEEEASESAARDFAIKLDGLIKKINKYPEIGRKTKKHKTVRQYKIDKNKNLYYRLLGNKLIIVFIFDNRQHPESNPY